MRKSLSIGLLNPSPALHSMLNVIGCPYEEVDPVANILPEDYAILILEAAWDSKQRPVVEAYLKNGGAVLELGSHQLDVSLNSNRHYIDYLINSSEGPGNPALSYFDLYSSCIVFDDDREISSVYRISDFKGGTVCSLGIDLADLWSRNRYRRKRFIADTLPYPDEIVSETDRHVCIELLKFLLRTLFYRQGLPWVSKWKFANEKPCFCFRIDSDYGNRVQMDQLYRLGKKHGVPLTWFLHVAAHENWLDHFREYEASGHEIALHGYRHITSSEEAKVTFNIQEGVDRLESAGFNVNGFCAPYGIWNDALKESLRHFDFLYTSEFTTGYDTLPFQTDRLPIQIPIHPVCTGSLARKEYSPAEMKAYFIQVLKEKHSNYRPAIFYHHPMQTGIEAVDVLFREARKEQLEMMTFKEYATFWEKRSSATIEAGFENELLSLRSDTTDLLFEVSTSFEGFDLVKPGDAIASKIPPAFKNPAPSLLSPERITQLKSGKLNLLKTSIVDWLNREKA